MIIEQFGGASGGYFGRNGLGAMLLGDSSWVLVSRIVSRVPKPGTLQPSP